MKSVIVIAAALALGGTAFAGTAANNGQQKHGIVDTVKQDARQIGSSARQDMHRIVRADKFRQEQAAGQSHGSPQTSALGAGAVDTGVPSDRQARMDAAYANWQRTHR